MKHFLYYLLLNIFSFKDFDLALVMVELKFLFKLQAFNHCDMTIES